MIWCAFRCQACETLDMYKKLLESAFEGTAIKVEVVDVMIIPDYESLVAGCIDTKIANLHKNIQTQHQWRFQAAESIHFPNGCKTTYRAYSSHQVVELRQKPKMECVSAIGRYTGLEACTVVCCWYPSAFGVGSAPHRQGVEGVYLLKHLPNIAVGATLAPVEFPETAKTNITTTLREVFKHFCVHNHADIRQSWERWAATWALETNSANDYYIAQLRRKGEAYHVPLKNILLKADMVVIDRNWNTFSMDVTADIDPTFQWPDCIVAAMNSVRTEHNPNPHDPRLYSTTDEQLLQDMVMFREGSQDYYNVFLKSLLGPVLVSLVKRRVNYEGCHLAVTAVFFSSCTISFNGYMLLFRCKSCTDHAHSQSQR